MKQFLVLLPVLLAIQVCATPAHAWTWPVNGPVLHTFNLGADPYAGGQHRGVDIGAERGDPVHAPATGTATFVGSVPGGGRTITIETADGYSVTLLHLGRALIGRGQAVAEGMIVAEAGASGTPEHDVHYVHLGIRVSDDRHGYLDPLGLLPARSAAPQTVEVEAPPQPVSADAEAEPTGASEPGDADKTAGERPEVGRPGDAVPGEEQPVPRATVTTPTEAAEEEVAPLVISVFDEDASGEQSPAAGAKRAPERLRQVGGSDRRGDELSQDSSAAAEAAAPVAAPSEEARGSNPKGDPRDGNRPGTLPPADPPRPFSVPSPGTLSAAMSTAVTRFSIGSADAGGGRPFALPGAAPQPADRQGSDRAPNVLSLPPAQGPASMPLLAGPAVRSPRGLVPEPLQRTTALGLDDAVADSRVVKPPTSRPGGWLADFGWLSIVLTGAAAALSASIAFFIAYRRAAKQGRMPREALPIADRSGAVTVDYPLPELDETASESLDRELVRILAAGEDDREAGTSVRPACADAELGRSHM